MRGSKEWKALIEVKVDKNPMESIQMDNVSDQLGRDITDLYGLATRVEGKGQYNMGKLLRAAADSLTRRHAFENGYNREISSILHDFEDLRRRLASYQLDP